MEKLVEIEGDAYAPDKILLSPKQLDFLLSLKDQLEKKGLRIRFAKPPEDFTKEEATAWIDQMRKRL